MANITSLSTMARQTTLNAYVPFTYSDLVGARSGDTIELFNIPKDAIITGVTLEVTEAFVNGAAADLTISVEDTQSSAVTYISASDADAAAATFAATNTPVAYTATSTMTATLGGTTAGDYTAGAAYVIVSYLQKNRSNEVHE